MAFHSPMSTAMNLLVADARESGQRRHRAAALRRLVFIGMLRDAGLALGEIAGILNQWPHGKLFDRTRSDTPLEGQRGDPVCCVLGIPRRRFNDHKLVHPELGQYRNVLG
jgi:DNA-binding transcriptional MerR regulator